MGGPFGLQEKGNTPLHIAAKAGQLLQTELLAVYGADPGALDSTGKTPIDYARYIFHSSEVLKLFERLFREMISGNSVFIWSLVLSPKSICKYRP